MWKKWFTLLYWNEYHLYENDRCKAYTNYMHVGASTSNEATDLNDSVHSSGCVLRGGIVFKRFSACGHRRLRSLGKRFVFWGDLVCMLLSSIIACHLEDNICRLWPGRWNPWDATMNGRNACTWICVSGDRDTLEIKRSTEATNKRDTDFNCFTIVWGRESGGFAWLRWVSYLSSRGALPLRQLAWRAAITGISCGDDEPDCDRVAWRSTKRAMEVLVATIINNIIIMLHLYSANLKNGEKSPCSKALISRKH